MEWLKALNESIKYIENNLLNDITADDVAKHINISTFYFQKIFNALTGISAFEYIRNRRLYLAGADLSSSGEKIIEIAEKYCYDNPDSFAKAFRRFHGITPSQAKITPEKLNTFFPLKIKVSLEGGHNLDYRIEKKPAMKLIGQGRILQHNTAYHGITTLWEEKNHKGIYGVMAPVNSDEFIYYVANPHSGGEIPEGFELIEIPPSTYVIFNCIGPVPGAMGSTVYRIFTEWLPFAEYDIKDYGNFNVQYVPHNDLKDPNNISQIWFPLNSQI